MYGHHIWFPSLYVCTPAGHRLASKTLISLYIPAEGIKRKLSAILSADVAGYSRLIGKDEDATIRILTTYRELMATLIQKHRGRVVDSHGENLLAEFGNVVDAVYCAVELGGSSFAKGLPSMRQNSTFCLTSFTIP